MKKAHWVIASWVAFYAGSLQAAELGSSPSGKPGTAAATVDLNKATIEELIELPGVGPAKARAIAEYRQKTPFRKVEDLLKVRGIGRGIFRQLRDQVTVREAPAATPAAPKNPR